MYKIIHIHTDIKFFYLASQFISPDFSNTNIFIGEATPEVKDKLNTQGFPYEIYPNTPESIAEISKKYANFHGAVLYDLDAFKTQLLDVFPEAFKFFWFFFGYEIYGQLRQYYLSKSTLKSTYPITIKKDGVKGYILRNISRFRDKEFTYDKQLLESIYKKIDAIFMLSQKEYDELSQYLTLPKMIKRSVGGDLVIQNYKKDNHIIIGNSGHIWNNHLDILKKIKSIKNPNIQYKLFFSYGNQGKYAEKVKKEASLNPKIQLIEEFLPRNEFDEIYNSAAALVINSYRQHAGGNIFTALKTGTKVYLNEKNSFYAWLKELGFLVYTTKTLKSDLKNGKFHLTEEEQVYNMKVYTQLPLKYSNEDFLKAFKIVLVS